MGKLHTFTRNEHLEQLSLGRRLHLEQLGLGRRHPYIIVGIMGISRVFQTFAVVLHTFSILMIHIHFQYLQFIYIQILTYKLRH